MFFNNEILVVDSDTHTLRIVKDALIESGFVVHFSHTCEMAMQLAIKNRPDLVLSEMALQDMDGIEFMRMVRNAPETSKVPFIFLTSRILIQEKIAALEAGADDYITKPFNENELVTRIKVVLRRIGKSHVTTLTKSDGIKGNLKEINLIDLIQLFDMGRKTAVIEIQGEGQEGRVYFQGGEIVHGVLGKVFGKEALFEILSIQEGSFLIHLNVNSKIRTIHLSSTNLIMEAMNRFDENRTAFPGQSTISSVSTPVQNLTLSDGIRELFEKGVIEEHQKP